MAASRQQAELLNPFKNLPREHGFEPLRIEGQIPADLTGTVWRNGPSLMAPFGKPYHHWFDGDGAISGVRFADGKAWGAARVVQSEGLVQERKVGKNVFSVYGTNYESIRQRLGGARGKNVANTSVLLWQDKLYALMEGARPTQIDRDELQTLGESDFDGVLYSTFSAHPHRVAARKTTYNFGLRFGRFAGINVYALPDEGPARRLTTLPLPHNTMVHDFIVTQNELVFFVSPLRLSPWKYFFRGAAYGGSLQWEPERGTEVIIVPIDRPDAPIRFHTAAFYQWHFANAFAQGDTIAVDVVRFADFASNRLLGDVPFGKQTHAIGSSLSRAIIDPRKETLTFTDVYMQGCDFPQTARHVMTQSQQFTYVVSFHDSGPEVAMPEGVVKVNTHTGSSERFSFGQGQYPSEALFVRNACRQSEDDGYLVTLVYDNATTSSYMAVLDAKNITAGPVAKAWFDHGIPLTFHGLFQPA